MLSVYIYVCTGYYGGQKDISRCSPHKEVRTVAQTGVHSAASGQCLSLQNRMQLVSRAQYMRDLWINADLGQRFENDHLADGFSEADDGDL